VARVYPRFPTDFDESMPVEVDIETNGLNPFRTNAKIHCMSLSQSPDEIYWLRVKLEDSAWYQDFFSRYETICRRGTFEGMWIKTIFGVQPKLYFDTKLGAYLIDENEDSGLKAEAVEHLGVPYWDDVDEFRAVLDWPTMRRYNARDVMYDLRLYRERHLPFLKEHPKIARLAKYILIPAIETFTEVICNGFHINMADAEEKITQCYDKMKEFNDKIDEIAGRHVNIGSPKQMNQLLYSDLGLKCPVKTKKGSNSSAEAALIRLAGKHEIVDFTLDWRKWKKYESTYLGPWINNGPVLHANYGFTATDTGRLNSTMVRNSRREKKLGATLHQCPRDHFIRNLITARDEDSVIVAADLSQIELRLVAHVANEHTMIDIFNRGEDIHTATASTLTHNEIDKETRKKAKAVNFGFVYGMWAKKFVAYAKEKFGLDLSLHEGELYREAFFDKYSGLLLWHSRVEHTVSQNGYIDSVFGRRRHLPGAKYGSCLEEWLRREAVRQGINSPIQSAGSDLNLFISNLIYSRKLPWKFKVDKSKCFMVGSAHDSQIFECKRDYVSELKEGIKFTLDNLPVQKYFGFTFKIPILMDVVAYENCWEGDELQEGVLA
jgi:DNA polymerase I-like protein with 3'-5' exonuclease and polymerase domains